MTYFFPLKNIGKYYAENDNIGTVKEYYYPDNSKYQPDVTRNIQSMESLQFSFEAPYFTLI